MINPFILGTVIIGAYGYLFGSDKKVDVYPIEDLPKVEDKPKPKKKKAKKDE